MDQFLTVPIHIDALHIIHPKTAVEAMADLNVDGRLIRQHAQQFDTSVFKQKMQTFVEQKMTERQPPINRWPQTKGS